MKMLVMMLVLALAACSPASPADQAHPVDAYLDNAQLAADTIEACRGSSEAEARVMAEKAACRNVRAAERRRWNEAVARSTGDWNDRIKDVLQDKHDSAAKSAAW